MRVLAAPFPLSICPYVRTSAALEPADMVTGRWKAAAPGRAKARRTVSVRMVAGFALLGLIYAGCGVAF